MDMWITNQRVDTEVYAEIKREAAHQKRKINEQIEFILTEWYRSRKVSVDNTKEEK